MKPIFLSILFFLLSCTKDEILSPNEVFGCTDSNACNYSINATIDNGSCILTGFNFTYQNVVYSTTDSAPYGFSLTPNDCSEIDLDLQEQGGVFVPSDAECIQSNSVSSWWIYQWTESTLVASPDATGQYDCNGVCGGNSNIDNTGECNELTADLVLNEFLASNDVWCEDGTNNCSSCQYCGYDYAEFINMSGTELDISGWVFGDEGPNANSQEGDIGATAPNGTIIPIGGIFTVWFTGLDNIEWPAATDGLSSSGESIWVGKPEDGSYVTIIDLDYDSQITNISMARCPDGTGPLIEDTPSPGLANGTCNINE